jgi:hypothetical protein
MLVAFLDDSRLRARGLVALGGLIVSGDRVVPLDQTFRTYLGEAGAPIGDPDLDCEVKYSPKGKNWFRTCPSRLTIYQRLLGSIWAHDAALISTVVRVAEAELTEAQAMSVAFRHSLEKVQACAAALGDYAIVICDSEGAPGTTKARIEESRRLVSKGTAFVKLDRIYAHTWAVDSRHHGGIQLSDLVVGTSIHTVDFFLRGAQSESGLPEAKAYWSLLMGHFLRISGGIRPDSYGFSILPFGKSGGVGLQQRFNAERDPYRYGTPTWGPRGPLGTKVKAGVYDATQLSEGSSLAT